MEDLYGRKGRSSLDLDLEALSFPVDAVGLQHGIGELLERAGMWRGWHDGNGKVSFAFFPRSLQLMTYQLQMGY